MMSSNFCKVLEPPRGEDGKLTADWSLVHCPSAIQNAWNNSDLSIFIAFSPRNHRAGLNKYYIVHLNFLPCFL